MRINQILPLEDDLESELKSGTKDVKKSLERVRKSESDLSEEQVPQKLRSLLDDLRTFFSLTAKRTWNDANSRIDVVVDGQTVVSDVPVQYLIAAESQLKYVRDALRRVPISTEDEQLEAISGRVEKLHNAVRFARQEANAQTAEDAPYGDQMVNYLLDGHSGLEKTEREH